MGLAKQRWMEQQEDDKITWIQKQLNDPDADEYTDGWTELEERYDATHAFSSDFHYQDDWSVFGKSRIEIFDANIQASKEILALTLSISASKNLLVMLHAHVVTAIEAYLSSTFISTALSTDEFMRKLVETDPELAKRKFTFKELFAKRENLKNELSQYLKDLIFHDIEKVKPMYWSVFDIDFGDIDWLFKAVSLRHHCVHRSGYDKDGNEVPLTKDSIEELINKSSELIHKIESMVIALPVHGLFPWER